MVKWKIVGTNTSVNTVDTTSPPSSMAKATYGTGTFLVMNMGERVPQSANRLLATVGYETAQSLAEKVQYNPQPYDNIKDGGTLTTSLAEISPQFNTFQTDGTAYTLTLWRWYNPILITFTADGDAVYNPDYLTDVKPEIVDGNSRITYTINPKATYNDGAPIDWHSFESTWKTSNGKDPAYLVGSTDGYDRITSVVRGIDDRQAVGKAPWAASATWRHGTRVPSDTGPKP